jgi:L,D-transpeptidase catalytic domain
MSSRLLNALGAVAVVVAIVSLSALVLAAVHSDSAPTTAAQTYAVEPGAAKAPPPVAPPPSAAPAAESSARPAAPVPALAQRPARGPAFAIAHLRPGARTALWSTPGHGLVAMLGPRTEFGSTVVLSVVKTRPAWLAVASPAMPDGRLGWVRRDPRRVEVYWTKYSLHANLSGHSLALRYGTARVGRFLVTVGAPGSETPLGRYGITDALSFDESPYYGCCALALSGRQTRLPEGWIGGDRLAIHGTPGPVGGAESHGCIRATDATMRLLFERVPLGTPVFIRE